MSAITIAFSNQKGGVGKSTLAVQFALYARCVKKKKVLFIDLDAQGNATTNLTYGMEFGGEITYAKDLFFEGLEVMNCFEAKHGIHLLGTTKNCKAMTRIEQLDHDCAQLPRLYINFIKDDYDIVVVDTPPALGTKLLAGVVLADFVVSPAKLSNSAFDGLEGLFDSITEVKEEKEWNPDVEFLGYVINDFDRTANQRNTLAFAREQFPEIIFDTVITHRAPIDQSTAQGEFVGMAANSKSAVKELESFYKEVFKRMKNF